MNGGVVVIVASMLAAAAAFMWMAWRLGEGGGKGKKGPASHTEAANRVAEQIFDEKFREELKNRGRLHFEKIIGENAMFLQQDLRLTTSQLNDYMKQEITRKLKEEFDKYEQSIMDAKQLAIDSIQKTNQAIDEERAALIEQIHKELSSDRANRVKMFEANMADIINHYLMAAIGDQIDLSDQLEYILANFEQNKQAIIEDISNGT